MKKSNIIYAVCNVFYGVDSSLVYDIVGVSTRPPQSSLCESKKARLYTDRDRGYTL